MRRLLLLLVAALSLAAVPARAQDTASGRRITPYFNMALGENLFIQKTGDFFSGGNMSGNVGLLGNITQNGNHALFGMYTLGYDGPGVQPQDTQEWQYRTLSHLFNIEYRWKLPGKLDHFRLRPGIVISRSYVRTGANEVWGQGLYDSKSMGETIAADYLFSNGSLSLSYGKRRLDFPNYTDLLREFQQGQANNASVSGGLEDQDVNTLGVNLVWKKLFAGITSSNQDYRNQKVVDASGIYDANTKQKDKTLSANAGFTAKVWRFEIQPSVTYSKLDSNQNFIRYKFFGATPTGGSNFMDPNGDVTYVKDYYSYTAYSFNLPFYFNLTRMGTAISVAISGTHRVFKDRPPQDANQNYTGGKQTDNLYVQSIGIRKRLNDIAFMHLKFSQYFGSSNDKFEKYLPYNFTATSVGMAFEIVY